MEIVEQKQDEAVHNIIKVFLAQMNSAVKISEIIMTHTEEDNELTGDHIISGLIYRLMIPMTDEDINDSFNTADEILNGLEDEENSEEEESDESDELEEYEIPKVSRKLKTNSCECDICKKVRECILKYDTYETYDPLVTRFKDSIKKTCMKHNIYL